MTISLDKFKKRATSMLQEAFDQMEGKDRPQNEWWEELKELMEMASDEWAQEDDTGG